MPDVFVSGSEKVEGGGKLGSNRQRGSVVGRTRKHHYHPLSPFMVWPKNVRVEVQEEEEEILLLVRQHPIVNLRWILVAILMLAASGLFSLFPAFQVLPERFQMMTNLIWYLFVTAVVLEGFFNWYFDVFIITDERIIDIDFNNLIYKNITYTKIDKIEDVTYSVSGVFPSLLNFGTILIQTAGPANFGGFTSGTARDPQALGPLKMKQSETVPTSEIINAPNPQQVVQLINEMMNEEEQEKLEGRVK